MKQSREQRFYPWAHASHGLRLSVLSAELDGRCVGPIPPRASALELGASWTRAELVLELRAPRRVVRRLVPKHERDAPPAAVLVTLRCDRSYLRERVGMQPWEAREDERFIFPLSLAREQLAGSVELDACLVRTASAQQGSRGVASLAGMRLAGARTFTLIIDELEPRAGNDLDIQYRSFAADPAIAGHLEGALYRLELETDEPILYLNVDHEQVRPVLDSKGTRGPRARLRELLFERIEVGVWTQLVLRASARLVEDGELAYTWEGAILNQWLPRLYPEQTHEDERRACLERDYQRLPSLLARLDGAMQVEGKLAQLATKLMEELT